MTKNVVLCILFLPKVYYLFFRKQAECQLETFTGLKYVDTTMPPTAPLLLDPSVTPAQVDATSKLGSTTEKNGTEGECTISQASNKAFQKDTADVSTQT